MKIDEEKLRNMPKAALSIAIGTLAGIGTYVFFLYFDIAIFGWNFGLVFAPLVAGYVETYVARKLIGDGIGAISAFILFIITVVYGFIIDNSTLGLNLITVGSLIVILQAATPIAINYTLIVTIVGSLSYLTGFFKKVVDKLNYILVKRGKKEPEPVINYEFDEWESNKKINSQDFYYISSTDIPESAYENMGYFYSMMHIERDGRLVTSDPELLEKKHLKTLKTGKDECLIKLAQQIKEKGGNGVVDLEINYFLNGLGGSFYEIVAQGMGVKIKEPDRAS